MKHYAELESEWRTASVTRDFHRNVKSGGLTIVPFRANQASVVDQTDFPTRCDVLRFCQPGHIYPTMYVHGDAGERDPFDGQRKRSSLLSLWRP
jgi:hypothetical protein